MTRQKEIVSNICCDYLSEIHLVTTHLTTVEIGNNKITMESKTDQLCANFLEQERGRKEKRGLQKNLLPKVCKLGSPSLALQQ